MGCTVIVLGFNFGPVTAEPRFESLEGRKRGIEEALKFWDWRKRGRDKGNGLGFKVQG